jgi:hypothetical protein
MKRPALFGNVERVTANLYKTSLRNHRPGPKNLKGNCSETGAILPARLGRVSQTAEQNKHRLVTLYRIAVDEVKKANQS